MLNQVRVHPELVTGTQDLELDPTRWVIHQLIDLSECESKLLTGVVCVDVAL